MSLIPLGVVVPDDKLGLTTLSQTNSGLTIGISRPGSRFDVVANTGGQLKAPTFGNRSLDPFIDVNNSPFFLNFSKPVSSVSMQMGDYGNDSPDILRINAYSGANGSGSLLATGTGSLFALPGNPFSYLNVAAAGIGIQSISFIGGTTSFPNSVFYDNIAVTLMSPPVSSSVKDFLFPLSSSSPVYLNTEAKTGTSADCNGGCFDTFHIGNMALDFDVDKIGTPDATRAANVLAVRDGTVVQVKTLVLAGGHKYPVVTIRHAGGYYSEYAEFFTGDPPSASEVLVKEGDLVTAGQKIGTLTAGTGKHLHFAIKYNPTGNGLSSGLSRSDNPNLQDVSIGGKKFTDFKLGGTVAAPTQVQIYGRNDPLLANYTDLTTKAAKFNIVVGNLGVGKSGDPIYIDPELAIGYDYEVLSGPNFASMLLPNIGDGQYELWLWNELLGIYVFDQVVGHDVEFDFANGGVNRFRILGIELVAGLDPNDPLAFMTGLTFTGAGEAEMTMTPLTITVPEPGSLALLATALAAMAFAVRRRVFLLL